MTTAQLFPRKKQLPRWIPTPSFENTLHKLLKSPFKEKMTVGLKHLKFYPFGT